MECDAIVKNRNITPLIYNHILFKEGGQEQFLKELSELYNKFGLDSRLNIRDFLLAEMTFNFLAVINNTIDKENEMKDCNTPIFKIGMKVRNKQTGYMNTIKQITTNHYMFNNGEYVFDIEDGFPIRKQNEWEEI